MAKDLKDVKHLLPKKRPGKRGAEPGIGSFECQRRYITDEFKKGGKTVKSTWVWPEKEPSKEETRALIAIMLEIAVKFFFDNFVYTFGGDKYLQSSGGPIGASLTMAIARLVMQDWWESFDSILNVSGIKHRLHAISVDDGRMIVHKLKKGVRYDKERIYS